MQRGRTANLNNSALNHSTVSENANLVNNQSQMDGSPDPKNRNLNGVEAMLPNEDHPPVQ